MDSNLYPILSCPCIIKQHETTFYLPSREVTVTLPSNLAKRLIKLCDGTHQVKDLIEHLSLWWDYHSLEQLFENLMTTEVLLQSRNISPSVWHFIRNPTAWKPDLPQNELEDLMLDGDLQQSPYPVNYQREIAQNVWTNMLEDRFSCRNMTPEGVSEDALIRVLWSGYGTIHSNIEVGNRKISKRTVPSAGALYPIAIYACIMKKVGSIEPGAYRITMPQPGAIDFHLVGHTDDIKQGFASPEVLSKAVGCIVVSASILRSSIKYGNRAMLYCALEAGHVAQNIHLAAQHEGIGTIEIGGFFEKEFSELLQMPSEMEPLVAIVFGGVDKEKCLKTEEQSLSESDIIRNIEEAVAPVQGYQLPFSMVFAESVTPSTGTIWWSCGRDAEREQALLKAKAEAVEWFVCGCASRAQLTDGSFSELEGTVIDPQKMVRYFPWQFELVPKMKPFDVDQEYQWLPVESVTDGSTALVLADFAFFPYTPKFGSRYAFANSSGVAAHRTVEAALEHAVLEIVEREAFMVTWLNRLRRTSFLKESLPGSIQSRIRALEMAGFRVGVIDITYDLTPVVLIVLSYEKEPFFSCSTASGYDYESIIDRSLKEAEASAYCRLRDGASRAILTAGEITSTMDHGGFYENARHRNQALFLFGNQNEQVSLRKMERQVCIRSRKSLYDSIAALETDIYFADLTMLCQLDNLSFKVIRAFIPGMVPMSFGYGIESFELERVQTLPVRTGILPKRVGAHRLNRLPHPFT